MRSLLIIVVYITLSCFSVYAQYNPSSLTVSFYPKTAEQKEVVSREDSLRMIREKEWDKHLIINSDSRLDSLVQIHCEENARKKGIDGFRVQIFQGTKDEAYQVKAKFINLYENINADVSFNAPDFRVKVGDFRTRSEAIKLKQLIKNEFPVSFVVEDLINLPELNFSEASNTGILPK